MRTLHRFVQYRSALPVLDNALLLHGDISVTQFSVTGTQSVLGVHKNSIFRVLTPLWRPYIPPASFIHEQKTEEQNFHYWGSIPARGNVYFVLDMNLVGFEDHHISGPH
jgi:hypothetical protein